MERDKKQVEEEQRELFDIISKYSPDREPLNFDDIQEIVSHIYSAVDKLLDLIAETHGCDKLVVGCYAHLLSDVFGYEQYFTRDEITVEELVREYPDKRLIIRVRGHLTSSIFGTLLDIWNCKDEVVDCFWIVE